MFNQTPHLSMSEKPQKHEHTQRNVLNNNKLRKHLPHKIQ